MIITVLTDFTFLQPGETWPPASEKSRIDRYSRCVLLFEGDHSAAFPLLNLSDDPRQEEIVCNWFRRSTTLISDLAAGSPPKITAEDQDALDRILDQNDFHLQIYDLIGDVLKFGNGVLKIRFDGRRGIIERVDPRYWFPVVSPDDARDVQAHCICYNFSQYEDHVQKHYLRCEVHRKGSIENKLFDLDSGGRIVKQLPISLLPRYAGMQAEEETGVPEFLVIPISATLQSNGVYGLDDFQDIEGLVRELEKRLIRTSKTLDKFSDPNIAGPSSVFDIDPDTGEASITMGGGHYFEVGEGDVIPSYMTWDASLQSNFSQIEEIKSELLAVAEISPALLGDVKNGLAESGSALKRLAIPTLAKVARLRLRMKRPVLEALRLCAALEVASRMPGAAELANLSLEWRSSLPKDDMERAQIEMARKSQGLTSTRAALSRLDEDASSEDLDAEVELIEEERQAESLSFM